MIPSHIRSLEFQDSCNLKPGQRLFGKTEWDSGIDFITLRLTSLSRCLDVFFSDDTHMAELRAKISDGDVVMIERTSDGWKVTKL